MDVLLSIKPKYVESIVKGQKRYEFRKTIFRKNCIYNVYIYATSPIKRVVGAFKIGEIIEDRPTNLWERLDKFSGLDEDEFFDYFRDDDVGFAIEIRDVEMFDQPLDPVEVIPDFMPPQSFCYVKSSLFIDSFKERRRYRRLQDY